MIGSIKKRLVAAAKFLVAATKILFVVPKFVAVTKSCFPCNIRLKKFQNRLHLTMSLNIQTKNINYFTSKDAVFSKTLQIEIVCSLMTT